MDCEPDEEDLVKFHFPDTKRDWQALTKFLMLSIKQQTNAKIKTSPPTHHHI